MPEEIPEIAKYNSRRASVINAKEEPAEEGRDYIVFTTICLIDDRQWIPLNEKLDKITALLEQLCGKPSPQTPQSSS